MSDVLTITAPIFILIALGYALTRAGFFKAEDARNFGGFVLKIALPALVFRALAMRPLSEIIHVDYLIVYLVASLAAFVFAFLLASVIGRQTRAAAAMQALGSSSSNSGFIGYPVAALLLGAQAGVGLALAMIVENIFIIPLALILAESAAHKDVGALHAARAIAVKLIANPLLLSIVFGVLVSITGVSLPSALSKSIDLLANASTALALFAVGGTLYGLQLNGRVVDISRVVIGKLLVHPALVWLGLSFAPGLAPEMKRMMLVFSAAPMLGVFPLLCRPYGEEQMGAGAVLAATAISFFTLSLLIAFV